METTACKMCFTSTVIWCVDVDIDPKSANHVMRRRDVQYGTGINFWRLIFVRKMSLK